MRPGQAAISEASDRALEESRHGTAKRALSILVARDEGFVVPTASQRKKLLVAFAERNKVLYGKAFDAVQVEDNSWLDDVCAISKNIEKVWVYEVKATNRRLDAGFHGYFFALTSAELLVAQSLKRQYRFAFVSTVTGDYLDLSLSQIFGKAKAIYPTFSISF